MSGVGYYDRDGAHHCSCGEPSRYQMFSGGAEFYCPACGMNANYPAGDGGPRARLLQTESGRESLRQQLDEEIARRRGEAA